MAVVLARPAQPARPVPPAPPPVAAPAAPSAAAEPANRLTRRDFATWEEFCDFKVAGYERTRDKAVEKIAFWQTKKVNKNVDLADKKLKKIEKLRAAIAALEAELGPATA